MTTARPAMQGMTVIELLVAVAIMAALMGLLIPALTLVRLKAHQADARQTVSELIVALDLYRRDDPRHRYPPVATDTSIGRELLEELDRRGLWSWGDRRRDEDGRLLDPWQAPYRYSVSRPAPSAGADALHRWNWDPDAGREARWGVRRDGGSGAMVEGALPFPYVWSLGPGSRGEDATDWIFTEDGK